MLGSAVQNLIALTDSVFLYHVGESDFAAIGFVGVFYLVVAAIGYSFSKGGQIMIARRLGEQNFGMIGKSFYAMLYFELALALIMFLFMLYGVQAFFDFSIDSAVIKEKSLEYLEFRKYGVFFSYIGVAIIALYTGVARTSFIVIDTLILAAVNIFFNYALIFGKWGFPEMGIAGAGLASTLAEVVAFVIFMIYILFDRNARKYRLFTLPKVQFSLIRQIFNISGPVVAQVVLSLGSWLYFFSLIENLGERELAISNLVRMVYLVLSIPSWGYASGINTLVSNFIGMQKRHIVLPIIRKTAGVSFANTMILAIPVLFFPKVVLYPLLGGADMSLVDATQPIFYVLLVILGLFSMGSVFFNGLAGTGATWYGLKLQVVATLIYGIYIYVGIKFLNVPLTWAWASEIVYWVWTFAMTNWYLRSRQWYEMEV